MPRALAAPPPLEVIPPPPGTPRVLLVDWAGPLDPERVVLRCPECGEPTVAEPYEVTARFVERLSVRPAEFTFRGVTPGCPACHVVFVPMARMMALSAAAGAEDPT